MPKSAGGGFVRFGKIENLEHPVILSKCFLFHSGFLRVRFPIVKSAGIGASLSLLRYGGQAVAALL
jgi:hypothetical protein